MKVLLGLGVGAAALAAFSTLGPVMAGAAVVGPLGMGLLPMLGFAGLAVLPTAAMLMAMGSSGRICAPMPYFQGYYPPGTVPAGVPIPGTYGPSSFPCANYGPPPGPPWGYGAPPPFPCGSYAPGPWPMRG